LASKGDDPCLSRVITSPRAAFSIAVHDRVSEGHIHLDTAGGGAAIADATLPVPAGWARASEGAALAFEWNLDLARIEEHLSPCTVHSAEAPSHKFGLRAIRAFLIDLDATTLEGRAALVVDLSHRRAIDDFLDFPGRSLLETKRRFGFMEGVRLSAPMFPPIDYVLTPNRALAAVGDGLLVQVVGDGTAQTATLGHVDLRPPMLTEATWNLLLENVANVRMASDRARTIQRLMQWNRGTMDLTRDGDVVHLRARGERR